MKLHTGGGSGFTGLFIERGVATTLVMTAITLFGLVAYRALPVSDLPNIDLPTLVVIASLPGANPETMATSVATPLERQFSTIEGLDSMTSVSALGATSVTLQFALTRSLDGAAQDVQTSITQAAPYLPAGMPTPPTFRKVNPADQPIFFLALKSSTMPLYRLHEYADTMMAQRISMVAGVAQVQILGGQKYAVRIQVNPDKLAARGIGIDEVEAAIRSHNVNLPVGTMWGPTQTVTLQATGQLTTAAAYRPMIVSYRNGTPVRLSDIATVSDSVEDNRAAGWYNTRETSDRSVNLSILRQPGTNTVEVADNVRALLGQFRTQLPPSVSLEVLFDRSLTIRESFRDIQFTMALTLGLVVMVIFLFLRNFSATIIPSLALPLSVIGTFAVMYLCDYSLDNLSMMALILAIGFVVDDAIVVLENIVRHIEEGTPPMQAAYEGAREVSFTIISMTLSLAAVFLPLLFMGGILGRLFREFAVSIVAAILISGFVSVTLTPMLCGRFLRPANEHGWFFRKTEAVFVWMLRVYERSLGFTLRHRPSFLVFSFLIAAGTAWLYTQVPKGFLPPEDNGNIFVTTEAAQGVSYDDLMRDQQKLIKIVQQSPYVSEFFAGVGGGSSAVSNSGPNFGRLFLHLVPHNQRDKNVDEVMAELRPELNKLTTMRSFLQNPPSIRIGGSLTKSLYQYTLMGGDTDTLFKASQDMEREMALVPGLVDVTSDLQIKSPQLNVVIDRDRAASLGVTPDRIENALFDAYGPRWVSTIYASDNQYRVLLEVEPEFQSSPSLLSSLYVRSSSTGKLVPLDSLARMEPRAGPLTVNHFGQLPAVTVSFNLSPGVSLGDAVTRVQDLGARVVPASVTTSFQGAAQAFQQSTESLFVLLFVALLVVYIVLGILYESFIHPLTILSGLPSAGFGALLTLYLFKLDLNIYSFVGLILLIGIVKKNAIMQIDFALEAERNEGKSPADAIYEGCLVRFRPIMMTTMCALFGALPIALGMGAGGEARRPLGLCVVGGLMFSQLITLYLTPVVYTYMAKVHGRLSRPHRPAGGPLLEPAAGD